MTLPGFTADAACVPARHRYRSRAGCAGGEAAVTAQWADGPCFDWECVRYCEERTPWDAGRCYDACQVACDPYAPPETLPQG